MTVLIDTNVLVATTVGSLGSDLAVARPGTNPVLVIQVLAEFWAVVTRPESANGLGVSTQNARRALDGYLAAIPVLSEPDSFSSIWLDLVTRYEVKGKQTHDARLVASMLSLGITHILTLNPQDFARFPEITTITP